MRSYRTANGCITISPGQKAKAPRTHRAFRTFMPLLSWCHWLQNTPFATGIRQSDLLFPLIEGSHIMALALSVGLILLFDLRLLRVAFAAEPVSRIMEQFVPLSLPGFAGMFITGLLLFIAQAEKVYQNTF